MTSLAEWNNLPETEASAALLACCGSAKFAARLTELRPFANFQSLAGSADEVWWSLDKEDWLQAFACHPRIGESTNRTSRQFSAWSREEQSTANDHCAALQSIAEKNREYERHHGFLYIVSASGRSAPELLDILDHRLGNSTEVEIAEAAEQQRQITQLRLRKLLTS